MADSLSSPSMQSGNVLALLNTLYTSGFAMYSPSAPLLKGRTMHTLYAISFIVCVSNCACDWLHVWATLQGLVTSFPIKTWLAVALVVTVVGGSMLTWLLLVLCIENAFAHRLDVTPYRSGFALILEAVIDWIQAFNNFRIAFLVLVLHDTPITILNFYFIASCRCAGPNLYCDVFKLLTKQSYSTFKVLPWSLLLSASSSIVSVLWRIAMLYFAYRRLLCPMQKTKNAVSVSRFPTPGEHFRWAIDISDGGRLSEWDECWPVRWACTKVYQTKKMEIPKVTNTE
uniref:TLC domain-containing protein n=1 Tax=Heterorhabditis bacteriophora TaxID=37862 RepID=A0A1I7X5N8_HETBA